MTIQELLNFARESGASDLHICAGATPVVRINGVLQKLNLPALDISGAQSLIYDALSSEQITTFERDNELDLSIDAGEGKRYRVNVYQQLNGIAAAFRVIKDEVPSFETLGLPDILKELAQRDRGLILVTGPTGCGKSTTLAAIIDHLNENVQKHVISIEDPVEYIHANKQCLVNQREIGHHTSAFKTALRSAMREDPDVILIGEMRDMETVSLALTAAETGHLVFSTLHTSSAVKTIDRILDIFPAEGKGQVKSMLSESLVAVMSQRLVQRTNDDGRTLALEILIANPAVKNLIREEKTYQIPTIMQSNADSGMATMEMALKDLVEKGEIPAATMKKIISETSL